MLPDGRSLGNMRSTLFGIGALVTVSEREAYGHYLATTGSTSG